MLLHKTSFGTTNIERDYIEKIGEPWELLGTMGILQGQRGPIIYVPSTAIEWVGLYPDALAYLQYCCSAFLDIPCKPIST